MNEYLTQSDLKLVVRLKSEDEDKAEKRHEEIAQDLVEMLNEKFDSEDNSWEFSHKSFVSVTKLPEGK